MGKIKNKRKFIVKLIIIIILISIGIFIGNFAYGKYIRNKYKNILKDNDAVNYEMTQYSNGEETNIFVKDKILLSRNNNIETWVSEIESKRIIADTSSKIAIITENDNNLKVNTLNYTYINDYFENSRQKFKYLGKNDDYYFLEFKDKKTKIITTLYLNRKTNLVDKMIESSNGIEFEIKYKINLNSVSNEEVKCPDLTDYHFETSVSSNK
ncbi:MAG: hypothetical protein HFJ45_06210 [Clostridia bacterium]|nr:hypothetical protein [Clostridia bacterium]